MGATESIVSTRGGDVLLRRAGAGPTVLFLHGAGGVVGCQPFFDRLSDRFDLLVPDHPSFGRSPTPQWLDEMADLAYFYLDFIDEQRLGDVHVIGHSMGGWLALEIAIRSQQRIKSLSLIASVGIRIKGNPVANLFVMTPEQLVRALYADPKLIEQELARTPTPEDIERIVTNRTAAARLAWSPRFFNPKLAKWLHRVTVPTQIVWGAQDGVVSAAYADEFKRLIPHAAVTVFPNAGHIPFAERLDDVSRTIADFIMRNE
ncbi:MAG TPA: alpha/beta hydrolase [Xanthobacteraceae bacterium]|nr:alpha/beta hydrolase [Xanthobacteraceae bacterium]